MSRLLKGIGGALLCVIIWAMMDRYLFSQINDANYYLAVFCAYCAGYGIPFSRS